jgi:AAA domain, putative AbiEii toxin, Type IV TA system
MQDIVASHTRLDFLGKAVRLFGFDGGEMYLRLLKKDVEDTRETVTYGNFFFRFTVEHEYVIVQDALSYGQKRLLSFLYYIAANDDIIIADELVNGMHYDWIEACLDEISDRESFLTSQNPLLLDFLPFESPEEVQKSFILCSLAKAEHRSQMVWKNMPEEEARSFFRSYKTKALQVSEILRSSGLW